MNKERFVHYTLGHPQLDQEHWDISQKLDEVIFMMKNNHREKLHQTVLDLVSLYDMHTMTENRLMRDSKYPYMVHHMSINDEFLRTVWNIMDDAEHKQSFPYQSVQTLEDKFTYHIDNYDRQIVDHYIKTQANGPCVAMNI